MRIVASADQLDLDLDEPLAPCIVHGDQERLRRLLFNLIDNAVKYTPAEGRIRVGLEYRKGQARIYVEDTGIGIASEHFPHIFDRFYRVDSARPRHSTATGLGLAICRSIALAHQGDLEIDSQPGRGTRITLVIPASPVDPSSPSHRGGDGQSQRLTRRPPRAAVTAERIQAQVFQHVLDPGVAPGAAIA